MASTAPATPILNGNPIRNFDSNDPGATAWANDIKGGHHQYQTLAQRDAITAERREAGMTCFVVDTGITYVLGVGLTNADWSDILNGADTRIDALETDVGTLDSQVIVLDGRVDALEADVAGLEVGDSFTVANLADLPGTVNGTGVTRFATVYNDSVTSSNNGRYWQPDGSSTWTKVAGDVTGRVANLELKTIPFSTTTEPYYLPDGRLLRWVVKWGDDVFGIGIDSDGVFVSTHEHPDATESAAGFMSAANFTRLINIPAERLPEMYANGQALRLVVKSEDDSVFLYNYKSDGVIRIPQAAIDEFIGAVRAESLALTSGTKLQIRTDLPDWKFAFTYEGDDALILGERISDGATVIPGFVPPPLPAGSVTTAMLADESVTTAKLADDVTRVIANDYIPAMPDDVRSFDQDGGIGFETAQSWQLLPREVTPVVEGINDSTVSLDFRKTSGLLIGGQRFRGTYDPSAVANSTNYRGVILASGTWPPSGTFADGDYYHYAAPTPRVIGSDTLNRGDLMIYVSGSWLYKAGPGSATTVYQRDFWEVSADGIYEGIPLSAGDRLVYVTFESSAGNGWRRWRRGLPEKKECFRFSSLPVSPKDRDLFEAVTPGTYAGFTMVKGDYLLRMDDGVTAVWTLVPTAPITTVPAGEGYLLPCAYMASEWEVIRTDRVVTTQRSVTGSIRGALIQRLSSDEFAGYSDSMGAQVFPRIQTVLGKNVSNNAYGGGTSEDVEGMAEWHISRGDPNKGKGLITIIGQNSGGALGQTWSCRVKLEELMNTGDSRFLHFSMLGTRVMTWNGTRLVCANFEEQWVPGSDNIYARDVQYLQRTRPDNWLWAAKNLCDAAIGDTDPDPQFPGKTYAESSAEYHIPPVKYCRGITPPDGLDYCSNHLGEWSTTGMPAGGNSGDYYIAIAGSDIATGFFIANKNGVWTNVTWDTTHLSQQGDNIQGDGAAQFFIAKGWA